FQRATILESQFLLNLFYSCKQFSEPVDPGNLLLSFRKWNRGRAEPGAALGTLRNATLRTDGGVIANLDMPNDTSLTANQDTLTDPHTAGNSGLRCDDGILADHNVVCDLHEIIDLRALLNPRPSEPGAINGRVGADLDIIVDLNHPQLLNLLLLAIDHFKAKTVRANHYSTVNDNP